MSGLTGLGGSFRSQNNLSLANIINPVSSQIFTEYFFGSSNLLTSWDGTGLTGLGGSFLAADANSVTSLLLPSSTQIFTQFTVNYFPILGHFDLTVLSNLTESNNVAIDLQHNNLIAADVNHFLVDLDTISTGAYTGRAINISTTNAAPDGSSGGFDGTTAKANLIAKGFTVTTT